MASITPAQRLVKNLSAVNKFTEQVYQNEEGATSYITCCKTSYTFSERTVEESLEISINKFGEFKGQVTLMEGSKIHQDTVPKLKFHPRSHSFTYTEAGLVIEGTITTKKIKFRVVIGEYDQKLSKLINRGNFR
jgi:hypothetical protein